MKAGGVFPQFLVILTVTITLLWCSSSGFSQSSSLMETGYLYSAAFPSGSVFNIDNMIENTKAAGFWIRIGSKGAPGALATTVPEYIYYHGEELLECPSPNTQCTEYPVLYAYPDDEAFAFVEDNAEYSLQISPKFPDSALSPNDYVIEIVPKSDIQEYFSEREANKYLLTLGIISSNADLSFNKGNKISDYTTFGNARGTYSATSIPGGGLGSILPAGIDPIILIIIALIIVVTAAALILKRFL